MGTNIDIITNNNIVFPTVRNLFTNGCILPYNDILTDINITMNDDPCMGNDSNLLIVFYVQIMPDDFVMQLHRF